MMKRARLLASLIVLPTILAASSIDQNSFTVNDPRDIAAALLFPNTVGVRSMGMGKVGVAEAVRSNAVFANPGILASLDNTSFALGGRVHAGLIRNSYFDEALNGRENYSSSILPHAKFTHLSAALPIEIDKVPFSMAVGMGYQTLYDFGINSTESYAVPGTNTKTTTKLSGGLNVITPALAFGIKDILFIGLTINKSILGMVDYEKKVVTQTETVYTEDFDGSAVFVTIGTLVAPGDKLSFGICLTPGYEWRFDASSDAISVPMLAALGTHWQVQEKLGVGAEVQTRMFGDMNRSGSPLDNGVAARVGLEYVPSAVALRLGAFVEPYPVADATWTGTDFSETNTPAYGFGASGGIGLALKAVNLDFGLSWSRVGRTAANPADEYIYSENFFRLDGGLAIDLPKAIIRRDEVFESDTTLPEPIEEPGRRKPVY